MPILHSIGDSHSRCLVHLPYAQVRHLPLVTMHRMARDGLAVLVDPLEIPKEDYLLLTFGEIDNRCHVVPIAEKQGKSIEEVAVDLGERYIRAVEEYTNKKGIRDRVAIASVVPPSNRYENREYPFRGTLEDRVKIQQTLNKTLEEGCKRIGVHFLNYSQKYSLPDGSINHYYSDQHVHIRDDCTTFIEEELDKWHKWR